MVQQFPHTQKKSDDSEIITTYAKYDKNGNMRFETNGNGAVTKYLYEYDKVVLELDGSGNQTGRNVYGTNLLMRTADGTTHYYMYNGHADVTALLTPDGTIAGTYYYDAFGNITEQTGDVNNSITYSGYQYDEETGQTLNNDSNIVSFDNIVSFIHNNDNLNLSKKQIGALFRINTYTNNETLSKIRENADYEKGPLVFFFEGAGSNMQLTNNTSNYNQGRYSAMAVVVKDGEIVYVTPNASTLPDQPKGYHCINYDVPTTLEGVYGFESRLHKGRYPALGLRNEPVKVKVDVIRFKHQKGDTKYNTGEMYVDYSNQINIHKGGKKSDSTYYFTDWANSAGCLTIHPDDYVKFALRAGFINEGFTEMLSQTKALIYISRGLGGFFWR